MYTGNGIVKAMSGPCSRQTNMNGWPVCCPSPSSDVTEKEREHRVVVEAWDWDRYTANDFIGGFSVGVREIIESGEILKRWYKLLDEKSTRARYEVIVAQEEAQKVCWEKSVYMCSPHSCRLHFRLAGLLMESLNLSHRL